MPWAHLQDEEGIASFPGRVGAWEAKEGREQMEERREERSGGGEGVHVRGWALEGGSEKRENTIVVLLHDCSVFLLMHCSIFSKEEVMLTIKGMSLGTAIELPLPVTLMCIHSL